MTREEIADKLEELAKGIREGKTIQATHDQGETWFDADVNYIVDTLRIKPDPKYIPFTADDWAIFSTRVIQDKVKREEYLVAFWDHAKCKLQDKYGIIQTTPVTYQELRDKYVFRCTDIPVGKEVKE
jgi:hypothetical protein